MAFPFALIPEMVRVLLLVSVSDDENELPISTLGPLDCENNQEVMRRGDCKQRQAIRIAPALTLGCEEDQSEGSSHGADLAREAVASALCRLPMQPVLGQFMTNTRLGISAIRRKN